VIPETQEIPAEGIILSIAMLIANFRWMARRTVVFYYLFEHFTQYCRIFLVCPQSHAGHV